MDEFNEQYKLVAMELGDIEFRMSVLAEHKKTLLDRAAQINTSLTMLKQAKAAEAKRMTDQLVESRAAASEAKN